MAAPLLHTVRSTYLQLRKYSQKRLLVHASTRAAGIPQGHNMPGLDDAAVIVNRAPPDLSRASRGALSEPLAVQLRRGRCRCCRGVGPVTRHRGGTPVLPKAGTPVAVGAGGG